MFLVVSVFCKHFLYIWGFSSVKQNLQASGTFQHGWESPSYTLSPHYAHYSLDILPSGYLTVRHGIDGPQKSMVYLLNVVIFHGYVSHNQMVGYILFSPGNPAKRRAFWACIWKSLWLIGFKTCGTIEQSLVLEASKVTKYVTSGDE